MNTPFVDVDHLVALFGVTEFYKNDTVFLKICMIMNIIKKIQVKGNNKFINLLDYNKNLF